VLGLKHGVNLLVDYDSSWPRAFDDEGTRIHAALPDLVRAIEHYGSTAIPGLRAKPIIDILVGVDRLDDWKNCRSPLEGLGYDYAEHGGVPGHYIFGRGRDRTERTRLVHVVEFNGESWRSSLAFRDALRADPTLRARYLQVKERAVALAPQGRARYGELKRPFFAQLTARSNQD
jgi:GrpB-like predicted nucleotidyltransferase (UPF0157 family)